MRTTALIASAVAAGVVGGGIVAAPMVLAAGGDPTPQPRSAQPWRADGAGPEPGQGFGRGFGMGPGNGMGMRFGARGDREGQGGPGVRRGQSFRAGYCPLRDGDVGGARAARGSLTAAQQRTLAANAEEEKLAHDVYVRLGDSTGDVRFTRVAAAESRHLAVVRSLLDRYDLADPTQGRAEGEFATPAVTSRFHRYVATGSASLADALKVGRQIERADVHDLQQARQGLDAPDVEMVYTHLEQASRMHLRAFTAS